MISSSRIHPSQYLCYVFLTFNLLLLCLSDFNINSLNNNNIFAEATGCKNYEGGQSNCPAHAPCCKNGYCSNALSFCSLALGCQPENSFNQNTCLPLPSCTSFKEDFNKPGTMIALNNFSGNPLDADWTTDFLPNNARIENGNLILTLQQGTMPNSFGKIPGFGATVSSTRWMLYGTVSARIKSGSPSSGIISSFIYRNSMTGDEIDYEWVGKQPNEVQSNFYWHTPSSMNPKDIDYSHARHEDVGQDLSQGYQIYTIEWLPEKITWFINGQSIRVLSRSDVNGTKYPSSPSQIQFSIWDGGLSDPETQAWAGGPTDWSSSETTADHHSHRPYEMYVDWVDIKCHDPVDPKTTPWPPKDQGFQEFVNPLSKDPNSPLTKEAIVLGDNAPIFSTLGQGGLHWGRYFKEGRNLFENHAAGIVKPLISLISMLGFSVFFALAS